MTEQKEGKIIGIDFGTTNSVVAVVENNEPVVIPSPEGANKIPSVVAFLDNNEIVVGEIARRQAVSNSTSTIFSIKRILGRSYSEIEEIGELDFFPYKIVNQDDQPLININGKGYRPEQIASLILKKLKSSAEEYLGEEVKQAIISVPAYFDDLQREATVEAAKLAGLEVLRLINEPTAAAMAYGLGKSSEEVVAVYDFGGGTFDITILEIDHNTFEVIHSTGDSHLGGDDLDNVLVEKLVESFFEEHQIDLSKDSIALRRLKEAAEKAKCELSTATQTTISLPFIVQKGEQPVHLNYVIKREDFEILIEHFIERTIECCKRAISESGLKVRDITKVILVGGSTRVPLVKDMVEDFFEQEPFKGVNPDEIVSMGAATQAGVLEGNLQEVVLIDVTPHSLGIEVKDNKCSIIIEKNSTLPIKAAKTFTTTEDNQTFVNIHALQGESHNATENKSLGKFILSGIEPVKAGIPRIRVTFFINVDGILEISACDMQSGAEKSLRIVHTFLSNDERERRKKKRKIRKRERHFAKIRSSAKTGETLEAIPLSADSTQEDISGDSTQTLSKFKMIDVSDTQSQKSQLQSIPAQEISVAPSKVSEASHINAQDTQKLQTDKITKPKTDIQQAEMQKDETQSLSADNLPNEIILNAEEYLKDNIDTKEAHEIYKKVIPEITKWLENHPDEFIYLIYLSKCYIFLNDPENALKYIKSYSSDKNSDIKLTFSILNLLVEKYPNFMFARKERAQIAQKLNETEIAIDDWERVLEREENEEIENDLIKLYEQHISTKEDNSTKFKLIKLYVKTNQLDDAIELLQDLIKHGSYEERATKILGLCYWQKNLLYLAWQKFRALPMSDEIKDILYRLAKDMESSEQLNNAKIIYEHIIANDLEYKDVDAKLKKIKYRLHLQHEEVDKFSPSNMFKDTRFTIIEELNRGSMGIIYKARDKILDEIVALKVLNDYLTQDPKAVERFKREARAARKISHPNIVRIHDLFENNNMKFISMEYIEGTDLKSIISEKKRIPEDEIFIILKQICDALSYAHKLNIIHRDIKPANIMINKDNMIKITDFGIAKILKTDDTTKSGTAVIGTPLYMSPEQIVGETIDARSDIYSLGIMLYEMHVGSPPFYQGNIEYHHIYTPIPPLPEETSKTLREIIEKSLKKKPEERFQHVDEIRALLT